MDAELKETSLKIVKVLSTHKKNWELLATRRLNNYISGRKSPPEQYTTLQKHASVQFAEMLFANSDVMLPKFNALPKSMYNDVIRSMLELRTRFDPAIWRSIAVKNKIFADELPAKVVLAWDWDNLTMAQVYLFSFFNWVEWPSDLGEKKNNVIFHNRPLHICVDGQLMTIESVICAKCLRDVLLDPKNNILNNSQVLTISASDKRRKRMRFSDPDEFRFELFCNMTWCKICRVAPMFSVKK